MNSLILLIGSILFLMSFLMADSQAILENVGSLEPGLEDILSSQAQIEAVAQGAAAALPQTNGVSLHRRQKRCGGCGGGCGCGCGGHHHDWYGLHHGYGYDHHGLYGHGWWNMKRSATNSKVDIGKRCMFSSYYSVRRHCCCSSYSYGHGYGYGYGGWKRSVGGNEKSVGKRCACSNPSKRNLQENLGVNGRNKRCMGMGGMGGLGCGMGCGGGCGGCGMGGCCGGCGCGCGCSCCVTCTCCTCSWGRRRV